MQAFHNDLAVKQKYVDRLAAHRAAEHLIQGQGWDGGKGCAVGCTLEKYDHALYPVELGLPEWLARLEDRIFEGLPKGEAEAFAVDFLAAIPVGANVAGVRSLLAILRHNRDLKRLEGNTEPYAAEVRTSVTKVIEYLKIPESAARWAAWSAARSAARSAESAARSAESAARSAESAARSAAWSAARSAWSAAESAESAAESAAWSAARSAWSAARADHFRWEAATLLRLLSECAA